MKKISMMFVVAFGAGVTFAAEGDVGTQAYVWGNTGKDTVGYKALDSVTYPKGAKLSMFQGKVILMNAFQYNCGGCDANAPKIGRMADSIGSGSSTIPFQAVGTEIDNGTFAQIQTSYNSKLRMNAANVNYPLVHVPFDTAITTDGVGTKWHRYNTYRDVYFVIDATGKIVFRVAGNRVNLMADSNFRNIRNAIATALSQVSTGLLQTRSGSKNGLIAYRQGTAFHFNFGSGIGLNGPVSLQIMDLQGRIIRSFVITSGAEAIWNGSAFPYGNYFLKASGIGFSESQRISWLP